MNWGGALFGAIIGLLLTRSPWGLLLGAAIGQLLGEGLAAERMRAAAPGASAAGVSEAFFRTTFLLMGHIAKADGRVSESEIQAARLLMQQLRLGEDQVTQAIGFFTLGKAGDFDADHALEDLRRTLGNRRDLSRVFMELQLRAAILGNGAEGKAHAILTRCAEKLGLSALEFVYMEAALRAQYGAGGNRSTYARPSVLDGAYRELEITAQATDQEVKKAYRRQMSRHHPDKLVANGLPESMAQMAKEKTQRIQESYAAICAARGLR